MCILILSEALINSVLVIQLLYSDFSNLQYRKILVHMTGTITVGCWHELECNTCLRYPYLAVFAFISDQFLWLQYYIHQLFYIILLLLLLLLLLLPFIHSFIQRLSLVHTHILHSTFTFLLTQVIKYT